MFQFSCTKWYLIENVGTARYLIIQNDIWLVYLDINLYYFLTEVRYGVVFIILVHIPFCIEVRLLSFLYKYPMNSAILLEFEWWLTYIYIYILQCRLEYYLLGKIFHLRYDMIRKKRYNSIFLKIYLYLKLANPIIYVSKGKHVTFCDIYFRINMAYIGRLWHATVFTTTWLA